MSAADKLTEEQRNELTSAFKLFDKDSDSKVSTKELGAVMRSLGHTLSENELQQIVNETDEDKNGTIELNEFLNMMASRMNEEDTPEDELFQIFKQFDKNDDGKISAAEIRYVMNYMGENLTDDDINKMLQVADTNNDGFVDFEEFKALIKATDLKI